MSHFLFLLACSFSVASTNFKRERRTILQFIGKIFWTIKTDLYVIVLIYYTDLEIQTHPPLDCRFSLKNIGKVIS